MRLALALKVAVVEEDTAVAEEDEVAAEEDKGVAEEMAEDAVANRLAPICVAQFNQDSEKTQKLKKLEETNTRKSFYALLIPPPESPRACLSLSDTALQTSALTLKKSLALFRPWPIRSPSYEYQEPLFSTMPASTPTSIRSPSSICLHRT